MHNILLSLLVLPFSAALVAFVFGKVNRSFAFWIAEVVGVILFSFTLYLFLNFTAPLSVDMTWFHFGNFTIPFGLYVDHLSLIMLLIATGLGMLDIHFAHDYMAEDKDQPRYYGEVLFFIGGMILLVTAKELTGLFVGWEFMGLASYLLISFWHFNKAPADAGVSAFLYTKFGDIFLFAAIGLLFYLYGTLDMMRLNAMALSGEMHPDSAFVIAIFIFIAAIGKSGQFPLFPWLMRAMEGPTTVSALIHGATMVNSGIYIVARLFDFYTAAHALIVVAGVAALSAFIGATSAIVQREMKKVLAYSTMSHLSLAFIGLGVGSLVAGMGHLANHAVFKALLFLGAGAVMLSASHVKDMWRLGGLFKKITLVALFMIIGALSLSGIPPFGGFYSKDAVLLHTLLNPQSDGLISSLTIIAGILSMAYIGRLLVLLFFTDARDEDIAKKVKAPSFFWIVLPLAIMAVVTIVLGWYHEELVRYISPILQEEGEVNGFSTFILTSITLVALLVYYFYYKRLDLLKKVSAQPFMKSIHQILFNGYYVEWMITWLSKNIIIATLSKTIHGIDTYIIDGFIVKIPFIFLKLFLLFKRTYTTKAGDYAGAMVVGLLLLVAFVLFGGQI